MKLDSFIPKIWTVYILLCSDQSYYTGCTNNFEDRFTRHQKGYIAYTKTRRPLLLVIKIDFPNKYKAYEFEKYLKSGSGKAFMRRHFV